MSVAPFPGLLHVRYRNAANKHVVLMRGCCKVDSSFDMSNTCISL
jgi:hypothetical protein